MRHVELLVIHLYQGLDNMEFVERVESQRRQRRYIHHRMVRISHLRISAAFSPLLFVSIVFPIPLEGYSLGEN